MADVITLSCPSCGAPPQITSDIDRFACAHCGAQHAVKRGAGPALLAPVVAELRQVRVGVDKTASELALSRLTGEVAALVRQRRPHKITHTPSWWVYVIGLLSSALAFGVLVDAFGGDMGCVSGGIAGVVIFGLVLAADDCMKGRRARDAERARLLHNARIDQEIRKRLEQIGRHRRLLSK